MRWWRVFPGEPAQLSVMRRWVHDLLPPCPALDDLATVASELAVNALVHTASGHGGQFSVEVLLADELVRVVIGDQGGPAEPHVIQDPQGEGGRGLLLVSALSVDTGVSGGPEGRFVWAELPWAANGGTTSREPLDDLGAPADLRILQERFPEVPIWFGRSTGQWWAVVAAAGEDKLVAAPSPAELASSLATAYASHPSAVRHDLELADAVPRQPYGAAAATKGSAPAICPPGE